jgi:hypothetical protein
MTTDLRWSVSARPIGCRRLLSEPAPRLAEHGTAERHAPDSSSSTHVRLLDRRCIPSADRYARPISRDLPPHRGRTGSAQPTVRDQQDDSSRSHRQHRLFASAAYQMESLVSKLPLKFSKGANSDAPVTAGYSPHSVKRSPWVAANRSTGVTSNASRRAGDPVNTASEERTGFRIEFCRFRCPGRPRHEHDAVQSP